MSEFKAQILGIILVLSIFVILNQMVPQFFTQVWSHITNQINTAILP